MNKPMAKFCKWLLAAVMLVSLPVGAHADSKYNLVFLGGRVDGGDVRSQTLGGAAQIVSDSLAVLQWNSAMLAHVRRVTFSASQYFGTDRSISAETNEQDAAYKFTGIGVAIPLWRRGAISLGYSGRFNPDSQLTLEGESDETTDAFNQVFRRQGGLFSIPVQVGWTVTDRLRVGAQLSFERGSLESRWDTVFEDVTIVPASSIINRSFSGVGWGASIAAQPIENLLIGATFESEIDYDVDLREVHTNSANNRDSTETMILPARISVSSAWKVHPRYTVYGSFVTRDFANFEGIGFPTERLQEERLISLGLEIGNAFKLGKRSFPVRISGRWEQLPFTFPEGESVNSLMFGIGTGLRFRQGLGKLDLGILAGTEGDQGSNLLENQAFRFYLGFSGSERWLTERQTEY